ncbi:MAG: hypothetical protein HEQ39_17980 [Rhizobacter sp.]
MSASVTFNRSNSIASANQYSSADVNQAFNTIKRAFDRGTVWNSDLKQISQEVQKLSKSERASLINELANAQRGGQSLLQRWLGEVTSDGIGPYSGLSPKERKALMNDLVAAGNAAAPAQNRNNLARLLDAFKSHNDRPIGSEPYQKEFASAVAYSGNTSVVDNFIDALIPRAAKGDEAAAMAIARQIGAMQSTQQIHDAMAKLDRRTTDQVVKASVELQLHKAHADGAAFASVSIATSDASAYTKLAAAVAKTGNVREKASFIAASGLALKDAFNSPAASGQRDAKTIADGMAKVMGLTQDAKGKTVVGTDTARIIENTLLQEGGGGASSGLEAIKNYTKAQLQSGGKEVVLGMIGAMLGGAELKPGQNAEQASLARFESQSQRGGKPGHHNAHALGLLVGAVQSGISAITADRDKQLAYTSLLFTGSADFTKENVNEFKVGDKFSNSLITAVLKPLVNFALLELRVQGASSDKKLSQLFEKAAVPRQPNGVRSQNEGALNAFTTGLVRARSLS